MTNPFRRYRLFLFPLLLSLLLSSCHDKENVKPTPVVLVDEVNTLTRTSGELQTFLAASGLNLSVSSLQYDVDLYHVTYHTQYKGSDILASGLVILPKTSQPVSMVSFQHGTITANAEAPSQLANSSTELVLYSALASPGFIAAVPDFIGFGSSSDIMHPYYVEELTASSVIDLLRAAKELAIEHDLTFDSKLFLAGYSQGGYATMATHKAIEANPIEGFDLIASFPASGGYDVKGMQEYFFGLTTYDNPYYLAYVARAYQVQYNWSQPLSDFFKAPYADRIPGLFNGTNTSGFINSQLTTQVADLVTDELRSGIDTNPDYSYIVTAFNENGLVDWKPTIKMYMYHGDADTTVPYINSVATYNKLISNGASPTVVSLTTLPGADHGSGVVPYIEDFIPKMLSLQ